MGFAPEYHGYRFMQDSQPTCRTPHPVGEGEGRTSNSTGR